MLWDTSSNPEDDDDHRDHSPSPGPCPRRQWHSRRHVSKVRWNIDETSLRYALLTCNWCKLNMSMMCPNMIQKHGRDFLKECCELRAQAKLIKRIRAIIVLEMLHCNSRSNLLSSTKKDKVIIWKKIVRLEKLFPLRQDAMQFIMSHLFRRLSIQYFLLMLRNL